jgi:hypothetical protein
MKGLSVYEVEWTTESGGNVRMTGAEVVALTEYDAMETAWGDYYCLGPVTCEYLREPTAVEIIQWLKDTAT